MIEVPIIIVEDTSIPNKIRNMPIEKDGFRFVLCNFFPVWIESENHYKKYLDFFSGKPVENWKNLEGYAIIIFDLGLGIGINEEQKSEFLSWLGGEKKFNQEHPSLNINTFDGLYLLGKSLQNQNWNGVAQISTTRSTSGVKSPKLVPTPFAIEKLGMEINSFGVSPL